MKLSKFRLDIPRDLILQYPRDSRDASRLMVVHKDTGKIEHRCFGDVCTYIDEDDVLVLNDTKVFSAYLLGYKEKTGARIDVTLLRELRLEQHYWDVLVEPARKVRVGNKIFFNDEALVAEVIDNTTSRGRILCFHFDGSSEELRYMIEAIGKAPIPSELGRESTQEDRNRYQTVYADRPGAITAPSAGLHFTQYLLKRLEVQGVQLSKITLHMGLGNRLPVNVEDLTKFKMNSEEYVVPESSTKTINQALNNNNKVIAVGVSTAKALESNVTCLLYTSPSPRDRQKYRMPSSA